MRYGAWQWYFFVILNYFCPFTSLKTWKIKILEKWKKMPVSKIILHMCAINENYDVWFLRYGAWQTKCFLILDHFLPFFPPNNPENQNFEKMKKTPGDIILSCKCTINDNHLMYDSWDMKRDRQTFLSFCAIFALFPH